MASNEDYFSNYMVLKPEKGGLLHLYQLLRSHKVCENDLVHCPPGTEIIETRRRWAIFVTILLQKLLLFLRKPMALFGSAIEFWWNLLWANKSFLSLLSNLIKGKVIIPDKGSSTYRSAIGLMDTRIELDKNITPKDAKYHAALSIMAAKLAYENESFIQSTIRDHSKAPSETTGRWNSWNTSIAGMTTKSSSRLKLFCSATNLRTPN